MTEFNPYSFSKSHKKATGNCHSIFGFPVNLHFSSFLVLENMFPGDNIFVLQVRGYSMIEDHIQDGDFIVVKKQETAINGERVVAMIDHEVTLKRFFLDRGQIRLEPCNSTMNPIIILPGNDARILGILIGVLRKC